jgi:amidase
MGIAEYGRLDGVGMAELVRLGELTARELVDEAIARIERVNPRLNAVVERLFDRARERAGAGVPDGAFQGVPFATKNLLAPIAGVRIDGGSRLSNVDIIAIKLGALTQVP